MHQIAALAQFGQGHDRNGCGRRDAGAGDGREGRAFRNVGLQEAAEQAADQRIQAAIDRNGLAQASAAILEELATVTRDTVYLMVRSGTQAYCIDCRDGDFPIRTRVVDPGGALELDQSALGLAILANTPSPGLGISDAQQRVMNEVTAVKQSGYAMDTGASARGVTVLAAPIRSATGTAIASVGLSAISTRLDEARCVYVGKQLVQAAREIERRAHQRIW